MNSSDPSTAQIEAIIWAKYERQVNKNNKYISLSREGDGSTIFILPKYIYTQQA